MPTRDKSEKESLFDFYLGQQIAYQRRVRRVGQEELAEKLQVSVATLVHYEKGYSSVPLFLLLRVASALRVSLAEIVQPAVMHSSKKKPVAIDPENSEYLQ